MGKRKRQSNEADSRDVGANMSLVPSSDNGEEKQLHCIFSVTDAPGELHFLVRWKDGSVDLIPAKEANVKYTQEVIRFYEGLAKRRRLRF